MVSSIKVTTNNGHQYKSLQTVVTSITATTDSGNQYHSHYKRWSSVSQSLQTVVASITVTTNNSQHYHSHHKKYHFYHHIHGHQRQLPGCQDPTQVAHDKQKHF